MAGESLDEMYSQVIEIAQSQAQSSAQLTELHRQNVTKMDAMISMLASHTTTMATMTIALREISEARARGAEEIKTHITQELRDRERKVWIALIIIALTGSSDVLVRLAGLIKG